MRLENLQTGQKVDLTEIDREDLEMIKTLLAVIPSEEKEENIRPVKKTWTNMGYEIVHKYTYKYPVSDRKSFALLSFTATIKKI